MISFCFDGRETFFFFFFSILGLGSSFWDFVSVQFLSFGSGLLPGLQSGWGPNFDCSCGRVCSPPSHPHISRRSSHSWSGTPQIATSQVDLGEARIFFFRRKNGSEIF